MHYTKGFYFHTDTDIPHGLNLYADSIFRKSLNFNPSGRYGRSKGSRFGLVAGHREITNAIHFNENQNLVVKNQFGFN